MKTVIVMLSLSLSFSVLACTLEAQFIGKVNSHRSNENNECMFQVNDFRWYVPSYVCPLTQDEVFGFEFLDENCSLKNGDEVSGVFVKSGNNVIID